jgi:autotransporter-associated beta strand protein
MQGVMQGSGTGGNANLIVARPVGAGDGVTQLSGASTYSGGTTISEGKIVAANVAALGTGDVTVSSGGTLQTLTANGQNGKINVGGNMTLNGGTVIIG